MIPDSQLDELLAKAGEGDAGRTHMGCKLHEYNDYDYLSASCEPYNDHGITRTSRIVVDASGEHTQGWIGVGSDDAAFIAACSPETIRALVEEVRSLRRQANEQRTQPHGASRAWIRRSHKPRLEDIGHGKGRRRASHDHAQGRHGDHTGMNSLRTMPTMRFFVG